MAIDKDRFIAGFMGSLLSQVIHPLELIKTRMQSLDNSKYSNLPYKKKYWELIRAMVKKEGVKNFYRGVIFSFPLNIAIGAYFGCFEKIKSSLKSRFKFLQSHDNLTSFNTTLMMGIFFTVLLNPFFTIKTWIFFDTNINSEKKKAKTVIKEIYRQNGIRGFYRGFLPTSLMAFNGSLTVFFDDILETDHNKEKTASLSFLIGGIARSLSSFFFYPLNTVRVRLMENNKFEGLEGLKNKNFVECIKKTWKNEGINGFYGGYMMNFTKGFLNSGVLFGTYNWVHNYLKKKRRPWK